MKLACTHALIGAFVFLGLGVLVSDSVTAAKFGEWSAPVNLGPLVNSPFDDISPHVSKDGLSLYFASTRSTESFGGEDIWISRRATTMIRGVCPSTWDQSSTHFQMNARRLFRETATFCSSTVTVPGGFGGSDIWVSWRSHIHDDFDWQEP